MYIYMGVCECVFKPNIFRFSEDFIEPFFHSQLIYSSTCFHFLVLFIHVDLLCHQIVLKY